MAVQPAEYSRFRDNRWFRQLLASGVELMWRPYRLRRLRMPATLDPVDVVRGDATMSLWSLAALYYRGLDRPEELWWLIADANDIVDPTLKLDGRDVLIPPTALLDVDPEDMPTEDPSR